MADFDAKKYEADMISFLKDRKFDKDLAKNYSATITKFKLSGYILDKIWRYGQPGRFDGFAISGRCGTGEVGKIGELIKNQDFRGVEIFPIGIINPDGFGFTARFGEGAEQFNQR